jgi:hypothetical protein
MVETLDFPVHLLRTPMNRRSTTLDRSQAGVTNGADNSPEGGAFPGVEATGAARR